MSTPVNCGTSFCSCIECVAQPKRKWVGLTEGEYLQIITSLLGSRAFPVMAAVEAKLKEKNV